MNRRNRVVELSNLPPKKSIALVSDETGDETDSITENSTVASDSSDDSFGPKYALDTIRHTLFGKVKSSAKRLARRSGENISPLLRRGNDAIAFKPGRKRARTPLTAEQKAARKRRRDNVAKFHRMLQRINQDPFVASRVVLALTALCLLLRAGDRHLAACTSLISVVILHQTTQFASTKALEAWYYVSAISLAVSVGSWFLLSVFRQNLLALPPSTLSKLHDAVWVWSRAVPRFWGLLVAFWLYNDIESSRDGDDNAIDTIEIEFSVLQARKLGERFTYRRFQLKDSVIVVQHGPILLGQVDTRSVLEDYATSPTRRKKFRTTAFSHFIESPRGSTLQCHMKFDQSAETLGIAKVAIPMTHGMKMSDWFPIRDSSKQLQGELLVEIQTKSQPTQFLFRASIILPTTASIVLAGIFWR